MRKKTPTSQFRWTCPGVLILWTIMFIGVSSFGQTPCIVDGTGDSPCNPVDWNPFFSSMVNQQVHQTNGCGNSYDAMGTCGANATRNDVWATFNTNTVDTLVTIQYLPSNDRDIALHLFSITDPCGSPVYTEIACANNNPSGILGAGMESMTVVLPQFSTFYVRVQATNNDNVGATSSLSIHFTPPPPITVGVSGDYSTIQAAYDALPMTLPSSYFIELQDDYNEALESYPLNFDPKGTSSTTITIRPEASSTAVFTSDGSPTGGAPLVEMDGCDYLHIDGRRGGAGPSVWTFRNTASGASGPVFEFAESATNNQLSHLRIEGEPGTSSALIDVLGASSGPGNDDNTLSNCILSDKTVGGLATSYPNSGIYSVGQSNAITNDNWLIDSCQFVDIFHSAVASYHIFLSDHTSDWTISNNHFYQTSVPSGGNNSLYGFIHASEGSGYNILNNYFGGTAPFATGGIYTINSGTKSWDMIWLATTDIGAPNRITNNTYRKISYTTTSTLGQEVLNCLFSDGSNSLSFSNNIIDSITLNNNAGSTSLGFAGIVENGGGTAVVDSNFFDHITVTGSRDNATTTLINFSSSSSGTKQANGNTLGGTNAGSIHMVSNSLLYGIANSGSGNITAEGNELRNFNHDASSQTMRALFNTGGNSFFNDNFIHDFDISCDQSVFLVNHSGGGDNEMNNNTIEDIHFTTTGNFIFHALSCQNGGNREIRENTIGNGSATDFSVAGDQSHAMIFSTGNATLEIVDNVISGISAASANSTTALSAIQISNGSGRVDSNEVSSLESNSTLGGYGLIGISSSSGGAVSFNRNEINQLTLIGSWGASTHLAGIRLTGGSGDITNNFIGDMGNTRASSSAINCGILWDGHSRNVYNNVIISENGGLSNDINLCGLMMTNAVGTSNVHFNTVQLSGTNAVAGSARSAAAAFPSISTLNLNNNLFQNLRIQGMGNHAINVSAGGTLNNDFNFLEATEDPGKLARNGGTDEDFATWAGNTGATNSITGTETLDANGLAISENVVPNAGTDLSPLVTTDKGNKARSAAPWIGAYEGSCLPLEGIYTIGGTSPDYATFTTAVNALTTCGISDTVVFRVRTGTYNEQITIPTITGSSVNNTITFESESGDSTDVVLNFSATAALNYTLNLNGVDYLTIRNMTVEALDPTNARVITIGNQTENLTINNCVIRGMASTSNTTNSICIYSAGDNDHNTLIENNHILLGSYSVYLRGVGTSNEEDGVVFRQNFMENPYRAGLYTYFLGSPLVEENYITSNATFASFSTFYFNSAADDFTIINNEAYLPSTRGYGITLTNCSGTNPTKGGVGNNRIYLGSTSSIGYGIYISNSDYAKIYHNSVWTRTNTTTLGAAFWIGGTSSDISVQNNIFVNDNGGYAAWVDAVGLMDIMDNNDLYAPVLNLGKFNGTDYASLAAWQGGSGLDPNSVSLDPQFVSNTDLHLSAIPPLALQSGVDLTGDLPEDIDGDTRAVPSWLGADESSYALYPEEPGSGYALDFDGMNDEVDLGDMDELDGVSAITVEAWVYSGGLIGNSGIISKNQSATNRWEILVGSLGFGGSDDFLIRMADGSSDYAYTTSNLLQNDKWMHIAMVYDGTGAANADRLKFYINGIEQVLTFNGTIPALTPTNSNSVKLGSQPGLNFNGRLDELKFWSEARSETEIRDYMCQKINTTTPGISNLVAYYRFDDGAGSSTLQDYLGSYGGTLTSMDPASDWVFSGASIGDTSIYAYTGTADLVLNDATAGTLTIGNVSGTPDSVHIYLVKDTPNVVTAPIPLDSIEYRKYWGTFHAANNQLDFDLEINYTNNTIINGSGEERGMRFVGRQENGQAWFLPDSTTGFPNLNTFTNRTSGSFEIVEGFGEAPDTNIAYSPDTIFCSGDSIALYRNSAQLVDTLVWFRVGFGSVQPDTLSNRDSLEVNVAGPYHYAVKLNNLILISDTITAFTGTGGAGNYTWTGATSTDWFDCKNWDTFFVPSNLSDVRIMGSTPFDPLITGSTGSANSLFIDTDNGGILNINSTAGGGIDIGP